MLNNRLHLRLGKAPERLLLFPLLALWAGTGVGRALQLQGDVIKNQVSSAAQTASAAAQGSTAAAAPAKRPAAKRAPSKTGGAAPLPAPPKSPAIIGLRDPFKLPPPPGPGSETTSASEELKGPLPPGTRGLVVNQLRLEGVVRLDQSNTMIAMVTSYTNRAYFLRENDAVYNGVVEKITPDSVSFKENYLDNFGRAQVREVVKRLTGAAGEGR